MADEGRSQPALGRNEFIQKCVRISERQYGVLRIEPSDIKIRDPTRTAQPFVMSNPASLLNLTNDRIAASVIFGVGLIGIIVNFTGVLLTFRIRALRTSFGRLTAVHCSADCAILAIFTFWCAPRTFFEYHDHTSLLSRKMGQVSLYFWFITLYSQLFISLNRFSLLFFPKFYKEIFLNRTRHLIIFYGIVCLGHFCVYFGEGCDFYYNGETYFWEFADTPCGDSISFWLDFIFGCTICVIVLLLDVVCVVNMRRSDAMMGDRLDSNERKLRSHREMRFLAQACCTGLLFTLMLTSFHVISRYVEGTWPTFVTTTLVWELSHLGDGIILFTFNSEMKRALMNPRLLFSFSTINSSATQTTRSTGSRQHREVSIIAVRMSVDLCFGFEWDRDYFINVAITSRKTILPIVICIIHPFAIFVVLKKSSMAVDCKAGYVCHTILMICFDIYNGFLYQFYTLAPLPILMCTGLLCNGAVEPATLLVILSFFTVAVVVPFLFLILRMHQRMLFSDSPLKVGVSSQIAVMLVVTSTLLINVVGFYRWTVDITNKNYLLNTKDIIWAKNFSSNFLVLGGEVGNMGPFKYELILLLLSIVVIFSFYTFLSYHAIYIMGRNIAVRFSRTQQVQLRLLYSLSIQVSVSGVFFVSPLVLLFVGLYVYQERWQWPPLLDGILRLTFLMLYSLSPLSNSLILLMRNPWCREVASEAKQSKEQNHYRESGAPSKEGMKSEQSQ